ncbi:MAG: carbamoyl-phosphate synthase (glutamine-hydrolyzing) large subunit [Ignavibacteriae bacterium]|nr:carbamoyl-phosphate synthase (glutamine-hydrolyzing) large subunit [Ignavibacteriota bacterium]
MPLSVRKVLLLGSGALKIGEAGEFDYSGSQALKALKEEGITTVLVNPNIATIQTSEELADKVYLLPVNPEFVTQVIERERPDAVLVGFGGQTALNCALALWDAGIFQRYHVAVLGTPISTIKDTEDRELFVRRLNEIGVDTPHSQAITTLEGAKSVARSIGYPVMVRAAYALGGLGSGKCADEPELEERVRKALAHSPQVLIEEYLSGWKEVEYEVVRDADDNCITVCNMENLDPLGIHTGESIVVAPSQTLTNQDYHRLREIAIRTIRHLGVIGECNIQYALDPYSDAYRVIEVNARLSRSSALASKATGYPLAYVAAKLALGHNLTDLRNSVTRTTTACFEPALDYIVVKIPRWDLKKFRNVSTQLGSAMKSVGEVMAIGRSFEETLQKAIRMLEIGMDGLITPRAPQFDDLDSALSKPGTERIFALPEAMRRGYTIERIRALTHIDPWFLQGIAGVVQMEQRLSAYTGGPCPRDILREAKKKGFSDGQIGAILGLDEQAVRRIRKNAGIVPRVKQIDTLAGEYPASTNYLYLTYDGTEDDVERETGKSILILGSGAYRIGSSVEFDWCCVNASTTVRALGYRSILVNYNPETVSTDYDMCDRLYFDGITLETVMDIYEREQCLGVIVSVGGQIPNNLAVKLHEGGLRILGTSPMDIDRAEDRHKFSTLLDEIGVDQPEWIEAASIEDAAAFADRVEYPVLIRPSYVLSGAAMGVATTRHELESFLERAADVSPNHPVVLSKFYENTREIEIDAVAAFGHLVTMAVTEHVENAGVHSGDATLVVPPQRTYLETLRRIRKITEQIAEALVITGPFNIQFLSKGTDVRVIECNLRASRSFPFVSKMYKVNFIDLAIRAMVAGEVPDVEHHLYDLDYVGVKAPQFSFTRLQGADPTVGVEMASTGEVGCVGEDFEEAFLKALISVGFRFPIKRVLLSTGPLVDKVAFLESARLMHQQGIEFYATSGTAEFLESFGIPVTAVHWPSEGLLPDAGELLEQKIVDLVINIPKNHQETELTNDYFIRRKAVDFGIPLLTNIQLANRLAEAMTHKKPGQLHIKELQAYA